MIYFTADLHHQHTNIMKYCPDSRAAANNDLVKMHQLILDGINGKVALYDTLYILGDVSFARNEDKVAEFIQSINCKNLHLVLGNHDHTIQNSPRLRSMFKSINTLTSIKYEKKHIVLCHYPLESWDRAHHGAIHLHGHCHSKNRMNESDAAHHGSLKYYPRRLDVGIDSRTDFQPYSFDEIMSIINYREMYATFPKMMEQGV